VQPASSIRAGLILPMLGAAGICLLLCVLIRKES
jgi:hypothetical protein